LNGFLFLAGPEGLGKKIKEIHPCDEFAASNALHKLLELKIIINNGSERYSSLIYNEEEASFKRAKCQE
jgi:hypothetical protein